MTYAGNGSFNFAGDGGQAVLAGLANPLGIATDATGNLYIADQANRRIRKVSPSGIITTIAGTGTFGFSGDGGLATAAQLNEPQAVAVDNAGNVYIADGFNFRIRKINTSGIITTIAGNGVSGFSGDGGPATAASMGYPVGVAVDASGNVYVADWSNNRIRKITSGGIISTFAGGSSQGFSGDGGQAASASLDYPLSVCVDAAGNVYIADTGNDRIRKVNASGVISTIAGGNGFFFYNNAPATSIAMDYPVAVTTDVFGNIYLIIENFNRICKINTSGIITTIANSWPNGFSGDGGPAVNSKFDYPKGLAADLTGNLYITDSGNNRTRVICAIPSTPGAISGNNTICPGSSVNIYSVAAVNGAATYSWSLPGGWSGVSTTNSISVTINGTSGTMVVTAINACGSGSGQTMLSIGLSPTPTVVIIPSQTISCSGTNINLSATGGNTYEWSTSENASDITVSPTLTTTYSVIGTNAFGCNHTAVQTISVLALPSVNINRSETSICSGKPFILNAIGASTFTWHPGGSNTSSLALNLAQSTTYSVEGTALNGCKNSSNIFLEVIPTPTINTIPLHYVCSGNATLTAYGASTYSWLPGNLTGSLVLVSPPATTNYTLIGANGTCTSSAINTVSLGIAPPLILSSADQSLCIGSCFSFYSSPNFSSFKFIWGDSTQTIVDQFSHCYESDGSFTVSALATYSSGCTAISENSLKLTVFPSPSPTIDITGGTIHIVNKPIIFSNSSPAGDQHCWRFGDSIPTCLSSINTIIHTFTETGNYCVKLVSENSTTGCVDSTLKCIDIICLSEINSPNIFTPNNDGVNDIFSFSTNCIKSLECSVMNRWGTEIYHWEGLREGWDGKSKSGTFLPDGVYVYSVQCMDWNDRPIKKAGTLQLIR